NIRILDFIIEMSIEKDTLKYLVIYYANHKQANGGWGDRVFGLFSAHVIAKVTDRKLLIKWDYPDVKPLLDYSAFDFYRHRLLNNKSTFNYDVINGQECLKDYLSTIDLKKEWDQYEVVYVHLN